MRIVTCGQTVRSDLLGVFGAPRTARVRAATDSSKNDSPKRPNQSRRALLLSLTSLPVLVLSISAARPQLARAEEFLIYSGSTYTISYPSNYDATSKAGADVFFKDDSRRGVNIGITRLPVRISSVKEYGSVDDVGQKVLNAEKQKDGTLTASMISVRAVSFGGYDGYEYEYEVVTTRGTKRIVSRVVIKDKELYVINAMVTCGKVDACDAGLLETVLTPMKQSVSSFTFI